MKETRKTTPPFHLLPQLEDQGILTSTFFCSNCFRIFAPNSQHFLTRLQLIMVLYQQGFLYSYKLLPSYTRRTDPWKGCHTYWYCSLRIKLRTQYWWKCVIYELCNTMGNNGKSSTENNLSPPKSYPQKLPYTKEVKKRCWNKSFHRDVHSKFIHISQWEEAIQMCVNWLIDKEANPGIPHG